MSLTKPSSMMLFHFYFLSALCSSYYLQQSNTNPQLASSLFSCCLKTTYVHFCYCCAMLIVLKCYQSKGKSLVSHWCCQFVWPVCAHAGVEHSWHVYLPFISSLIPCLPLSSHPLFALKCQDRADGRNEIGN